MPSEVETKARKSVQLEQPDVTCTAAAGICLTRAHPTNHRPDMLYLLDEPERRLYGKCCQCGMSVQVLGFTRARARLL